MQPLSGNSSDAHDFGALVRAHIDQRHMPYGVTSLVADSALYSADNLAKRSQTPLKWSTRVPATLHEAQTALAQANPQTMIPLSTGYRAQLLRSTYGGVAQRWALIYSELRQPQAQRTADTQWQTQSAQDLKAFTKLCRTTFACEADAQQALSACEQDLQVTQCAQTTMRPIARYGQRGRPRPGASPEQIV